MAAGNAKLMKYLNVEYSECEETGTIVHVAVDGKYAGHILISDKLKPHAKEAVRDLKKAGITKTVMLTGDMKRVADKVAEELGIGEVYSELLPADKVAKVEELLEQKSEKENAVKVTALAVIPKPIMLLTPQDVPTATEVTAPLETATVPTVTEETPQQVTFKTPLATATAETDLDITTVQPSTDNHRKTFNDASLQELAESIREVGVLQAIAVRPHTGGGYEIIYGERRYRASLLAGAKTIKATIYNLSLIHI